MDARLPEDKSQSQITDCGLPITNSSRASVGSLCGSVTLWQKCFLRASRSRSRETSSCSFVTSCLRAFSPRIYLAAGNKKRPATFQPPAWGYQGVSDQTVADIEITLDVTAALASVVVTVAVTL